MLRYSEHALLQLCVELFLEADQLQQGCAIIEARHYFAYLLVGRADRAILVVVGIVEHVLPQFLHEADRLPQFVYVVAHFLVKAGESLRNLRSEGLRRGTQDGSTSGVEVVARGHHAITVRRLGQLKSRQRSAEAVLADGR